MRLVLAIMLSVSHLAGPWLCCCGPLAKAVAVSPAKTPAAEGGCPHCTSEHKPADVPASPNPPKAPDRCPCCEAMATAVPADKPQVPTADSLLVVVTVEPSHPIAVGSVAVGDVTGLRELPHLTTADRLFTHHVLRC
jgi:hypothetical protein